KMGISTIQSYRGAQIFEAVGLNPSVVDKYFTGTTSRVAGIGLETIAEEVLIRHRFAFPEREEDRYNDLSVGGYYQWRKDGEYHMVNPVTIHKLQHATRTGNRQSFKEFSKA